MIPIAKGGLYESVDGLEAAAAVPVGSSEQHITVDGLDRTFHVYRPASLPPSGAAPLVVMLHGGFGSGSQAEDAYGWDAAADAHGFVVAYPDGENRAWDVGGGCCGKPAVDHVDDVGFVTQVVTTLEHELPIDADRVYITGLSMGGYGTWLWGPNRLDVFAALMPICGGAKCCESLASDLRKRVRHRGDNPRWRFFREVSSSEA